MRPEISYRRGTCTAGQIGMTLRVFIDVVVVITTELYSTESYVDAFQIKASDQEGNAPSASR